MTTTPPVPTRTLVPTPAQAARDRLAQALQRCREADDRDLDRGCELSLLLDLAASHIELSDTSAAHELLDEALALSRRLDRPAHEVRALRLRGAARLQDHQHAEALAILRQALDLASRTGVERIDLLLGAPTGFERAALHQSLGLACVHVGEPLTAIDHFRVALPVYREIEPSLAAQTLFDLGAAFQTYGAVEQAMSHFRQSVELYRRHHREVGLGIALTGVGSVSGGPAGGQAPADAAATRDPLTGLYTRRRADRMLAEALVHAQLEERPLSLMMADVDNIEKINDAFTHALGDEVLKTVADILLREMRGSDGAARYGGQTFTAIFPDTELEPAAKVSERLRWKVKSYPWHDLHIDLRVTVSIGVVTLTDQQDAGALLAVAEARLRGAKRDGRDQVRSE